MVGDGGVGKTCLLITYTSNVFPIAYVPTVFDGYSANLMVENRPLSLGLWDTAGQEDYDRLRPLSYPKTDCFVLCFSIADRKTFLKIYKKWEPEISKFCPNTPIVLVGTKSDLRGSVDDFISFNEGKRMAINIGAQDYFECSSLLCQGIQPLFNFCINLKFHSRVEIRKSDHNCSLF